MDLFADLSFVSWMVAVIVSGAAGFVKGTVGFGMPLVMMSGLAHIWPVELALSALILPTLLSNGYLMLRNGLRVAWQTILIFRRFLLVMLIALALSAQCVTLLTGSVLFLLIGSLVMLFCALQLIGWVPVLSQSQQRRAELYAAAVAGFCGGVSGFWGRRLWLILWRCAFQRRARCGCRV